MKFQQQQPGLFTFYREQQLYQDKLAQHKAKQQLIALQKAKQKQKKNNKIDNTKDNTPTQKIISQPAPHEQDQAEQVTRQKYKRYGEGVAIFSRKQTEHAPFHDNKQQSPTKEQQGTYLSNKNMAFQKPPTDSPAINGQKQQLAKRKQKYKSHWRHESRDRRSTKLPSLAKIDQEDTYRSPSEINNKISGSLLKANGSQLLRQIRSRGVVEESLTGDIRSVSYFQFNHDYQRELQDRRKGYLSMEQRKLLDILGRYRRYDH